MSADPLVYCLEHLTDYDQFERLSSDLMVGQGFAKLEPLGGMKDKGRDAIHKATDASNRQTLFSYSVREDWEKKLREDCQKAVKYGHACDLFVFVSTARVSATERDRAVQQTKTEFGWSLDLYSLERLRVLLVAAPQIVAQHPQIFPPPFFPRSGGLSVVLARDTVVVDAQPEDSALASWLARRLTLQGYRTWSPTTAPLVGEAEHQAISELIETRAVRVLSIMSCASTQHADFSARRARAAQLDLLIPITAEKVAWESLESKTRSLTPARFENGWASGISDVLAALENAGVARGPLATVVDYRVFAAGDPLQAKPETLYSNQFSVIAAPANLFLFRASDKALSENWRGAHLRWGFRNVGRVFLALRPPPDDLRDQLGLRLDRQIPFVDGGEIEGLRSRDLRIELLRKTARVGSLSCGLSWCDVKEQAYFPHEERFDRFAFSLPDGTRTWLSCWGERNKWRKLSEENYEKVAYRYSLAPEVSFLAMDKSEFRMTIRVRIRITDAAGGLLSDRAAFSRQRGLSSTWFNDEWFKRTIAVASFLAGGAKQISWGVPENELTIAATPLSYHSELGIDETAIRDFAALREAALEAGLDEGDVDDDEVDDE